MRRINVRHILGTLVVGALLLVGDASAQTAASGTTAAGAGTTTATTTVGAVQRAPSVASRPFVVERGQALSELERKLRADNKVEELYGGAGAQLRVAVQHDKNKTGTPAELHDASDDVYYVLEGTATLTLGGRLDAPREIEPGEWRSPHITGGQTFELAKGDLIIVPRGTPHQRSTAGQEFSMILIKIFAEPVRATQQQAVPAPRSEQPKP